PLLPAPAAHRRPAPASLGEDTQPPLPPPGRGVHARPVGLDLGVPGGTPERPGCCRVVPLPVPHRPAVSVTDLADGVVADRQPAELPEVGAGPLERPTGPG